MARERIKLAIAKGRILEQVLWLMDKSGYSTTKIRAASRELVVDLDELRILICKPADVPKYVELGAADCGIVGSDCIIEAACDVYEPLSLPIGECKMVLACPKEKELDLTAGSMLTIGTKYTNITRKFFETINIFPEIIYLSGSVELAAVIGLADGIVDITETGETIKKNNLKIIKTIQNINCKFIVNKSSQKTLGDEINSLASAFVKQK
ncbi:MAG: ATP phosphoribosyltransferase [Thermodesulfobacteriota bacterium]|nr:ATP phosphoribosyltransferase [Thermodesulfobacteriota bacterium]